MTPSPYRNTAISFIFKAATSAYLKGIEFLPYHSRFVLQNHKIGYNVAQNLPYRVVVKKVMSTKRSKKTGSKQTNGGKWNRVLLALPLTPLAAGLLLIFGAILEIVVWISAPAQVTLGGLLVLGSFVLLNAVQKQWFLAAGWLLVGVSFWLWLGWPGTWVRGVAYLVGGAGIVFLAREFVVRYRQEQRQKSGKKRKA